MNTKMKRIAIAAVAVLAFASMGGAAIAKTPTQRQGSAATSEATTGADTDTIQQGDQSSPDTSAEATGETGGETTSESDGPGGHEDPAGNVDHQFDGEE
jgi:hypothetical protein